MMTGFKKLRRNGVPAIFVVFATTSVSTAETFLDTRSLFDVCTRADEAWVSFCNGYIQAAADVATLGGNACIPNGVTRTRIASGFQEQIGVSLALDPVMGEESGIGIMVLYLSETYPC